MSKLQHTSAKSSHYNKEAEFYDAFNEKNSKATNKLIEKICANYQVKTILDLTCGTGSQVFHLVKQGYQAVGFDINVKMLNLAKAKAKKQNLDIKFAKGDVRTTKVGKFDAVITVFNAIGHLTKDDFEIAIRNVSDNLNESGLYIFDIFNLSYLLAADNITKLTIDFQTKQGGLMTREIQYSTIDCHGMLASYDVYFQSTNFGKPNMSKAFQTLQVYTAKQLKELLVANGFKVLQQSSIDGSILSETKTERILTIAQKVS